MSNTFKVGDVTTTRDGLKARIICVDRVSKDYPVIALIMDGVGEATTAHTADGLYLGGAIYGQYRHGGTFYKGWAPCPRVPDWMRNGSSPSKSQS